MKFSILNKTKVWIIITLVVLVVGVAFLGIFGLNKSVDFGNGYELSVSVDEYVQDSEKTVKDTTINFFESKGISPLSYSTQKVDNGNKYIYKFDKDVNIQSSELKTAIETAINNSALVEVQYSETKAVISSQIWHVVLGVAIVSVLYFAYLFFMEKFASSVTVIASSVLSVLLFIALLSITRIPAVPFAGVFAVLAYVLAAVLSTVMVNRFKEIMSIVGNEKLSFVEVADKGAMNSLVRFAFAFVALVVASLLLIFVGLNTQLIFVGLLLLVCTVSSVFASYVCTPVVWVALKNVRVGKKA